MIEIRGGNLFVDEAVDKIRIIGTVPAPRSRKYRELLVNSIQELISNTSRVLKICREIWGDRISFEGEIKIIHEHNYGCHIYRAEKSIHAIYSGKRVDVGELFSLYTLNALKELAEAIGDQIVRDTLEVLAMPSLEEPSIEITSGRIKIEREGKSVEIPLGKVKTTVKTIKVLRDMGIVRKIYTSLTIHDYNTLSNPDVASFISFLEPTTIDILKTIMKSPEDKRQDIIKLFGKKQITIESTDLASLSRDELYTALQIMTQLNIPVKLDINVEYGTDNYRKIENVIPDEIKKIIERIQRRCSEFKKRKLIDSYTITVYLNAQLRSITDKAKHVRLDIAVRVGSQYIRLDIWEDKTAFITAEFSIASRVQKFVINNLKDVDIIMENIRRLSKRARRVSSRCEEYLILIN